MYVSGYVVGYVSRYASGYVLQCWALDDRDVLAVCIGVCIQVCIEVCIGVCIGGVKDAPFHEFLTHHLWKQPYGIFPTIRGPPSRGR